MRYAAIRIQKNRVFYLNSHLARLLKKIFGQVSKLSVKMSFLENGYIKFTYADSVEKGAHEFRLEAQRARICATAFIKKIEEKLAKRICGDVYFTVNLEEDGFFIDLKEKLKIPALDNMDLNSV